MNFNNLKVSDRLFLNEVDQMIKQFSFAILLTCLFIGCSSPQPPESFIKANMRIITGILNAWLLNDTDGLRFIVLLPLKDLLGILVWLASLLKKQTYWRGKTFILKKGKMVEVK